jgi:macrolide-specific efflux system membrane fusion protein
MDEGVQALAPAPMLDELTTPDAICLRFPASLRLCVVVIGMALLTCETVRAADELIVESALLRLIQQVEVPARAQGVLTSIEVVEGDSVQLGDVLAQVDDSEAKLLEGRAAIELEVSKETVKSDVAVRAAKQAFQFNKAEHERLERAAQGIRGSISLSELEELKFRAEQAALDLEKAQHEARLDQLTVELKQKELQLSKHNVEVRKVAAPINGVVVEVLRQPGEWVEPGDKVLRIVRLDRLRVEGLIEVPDIASDLRNAQVTLSLNVPGRGPTNFPGKIVFVSPEINPVNGQVRIWAEVENKDGILKPGLRTKMTLVPTAGVPSAKTASATNRL